MVAEWSDTPDVNAALDFYDKIAEVVTGRIQQAPGIEELNDALRSVLAGLWCQLDPDRNNERLLVEFALRGPEAEGLPNESPLPPELQPGPRGHLPPVGSDYAEVEPLGWAEMKLPDRPPLPRGQLPGWAETERSRNPETAYKGG